MILPHLDNAVVPKEKLTEYLLSSTHEDGAGKARFFASYGFGLDNWNELALALLEHVKENGIVAEVGTTYGMRYVAEGPMNAVDGRRPNLRSVWFVDAGRDVPRSVTAYPLEGAEDD